MLTRTHTHTHAHRHARMLVVVVTNSPTVDVRRGNVARVQQFGSVFVAPQMSYGLLCNRAPNRIFLYHIFASVFIWNSRSFDFAVIKGIGSNSSRQNCLIVIVWCFWCFFLWFYFIFLSGLWWKNSNEFRSAECVESRKITTIFSKRFSHGLSWSARKQLRIISKNTTIRFNQFGIRFEQLIQCEPAREWEKIIIHINRIVHGSECFWTNWNE